MTRSKQSPYRRNSGRGSAIHELADAPTVYSTAQAVWTEWEVQVLQKASVKFPAEDFADSVTRYAKISSCLKNKSIRDVAFKLHQLHVKGDLSTPNKRRKTQADEQVHQQQDKSSFEADEAEAMRLLQMNQETVKEIRENILEGNINLNRDLMIKFQRGFQATSQVYV